MPRRPNIIRSMQMKFMLPEDLRARLELFLYSDLEHRVPVSAYQNFFCERIREFFNQKTLDFSEFLAVPPGRYVIRGSDESLKFIRLLAKESTNVRAES